MLGIQAEHQKTSLCVMLAQAPKALALYQKLLEDMRGSGKE